MTHRFIVAVAAAAVFAFAAPAAGAKAKPARAPAPIAILAPAAPETAGFDSARLARLNAAMHAEVDSGRAAGIQTLLVRHGRVVSFDTYGKASTTSGTPLTRDSIFRMYSQTKPVTGVAMMILFEQGKWRLDDPVTKYIPEFANLKVFTGLDAKGAPIVEDMKRVPTMRELMTHTAGFGYGLRDDNYVDQQFIAKKVLSSANLQEMIDRIATIPLRYQPGTRWSYSASVDIQGYIIEKLSGMKFSAFLDANIFKPLGMKDTGFYVPADKVSRLSGAYGVNPMNGQLVEITPQMVAALQDFTKVPGLESGGGGTVSTADDYARFCQMILNKGELNGVRILSPASIALIEADHLEPGVEPVLQDDQRNAFGDGALGFGLDFAIYKDAARLGSLAGDGTISWGGAASTWFWIDPKNDVFFIGMIQRFDRSVTINPLVPLSQTLVYQALTKPER